MTEILTICRPDDWHAHLREGHILETVLREHAKVYGRIVAMPNLQQPVTTRARARAYQEEINGALKKVNVQTKTLIPCYLTEESSVEEIVQGHQQGDFFGVKLYPVGATTLSNAGVRNISKLYPIFEQMEKYRIPLMMHGESVDPDVDIYDRERVFLERTLSDMVNHFPELTMTLEHLTTKDSVDFVSEAQGKSRLGATITLHHLCLTRNDMLCDGLRPDYFCYPLVKTARDKTALRQAATSGKSCYFLGTDSAPHLQQFKYNSIARAGIYSAPQSLQGYATVFSEENSIEQLEGFSSIFGAQHYQLPLNKDKITLEKCSDYSEGTDKPFQDQDITTFSYRSRWKVV